MFDTSAYSFDEIERAAYIYISFYSFEVRITSDECLEDIRIKEEWFCCDFKAKVL
jgi:hypothetical protein